MLGYAVAEHPEGYQVWGLQASFIHGLESQFYMQSHRFSPDQTGHEQGEILQSRRRRNQ